MAVFYEIKYDVVEAMEAEDEVVAVRSQKRIRRAGLACHTRIVRCSSYLVARR